MLKRENIVNKNDNFLCKNNNNINNTLLVEIFNVFLM